MTRCRNASALAAILSIGALVSVERIEQKPLLIWNRTPSAPIGLYWRQDRAPSLDDWALISAKSEASRWIAAQGYLAGDWPIIKQVRGVAGHEICRQNSRVFVQNRPVAFALNATVEGVPLPVWTGCRTLRDHEFFLLNEHTNSLDGRYFGVTKATEIDGTLMLLWESPPWLR